MAIRDLPGVIAHGKAEYSAALGTMLTHANTGGDYCRTCGRAWMCQPYADAKTYAAYWKTRLDAWEARQNALTVPTAEYAGVTR